MLACHMRQYRPYDMGRFVFYAITNGKYLNRNLSDCHYKCKDNIAFDLLE